MVMLLGEKIWKESGLVYKCPIGLGVGNRIWSPEAVSSRDEVWENYWQQDGVTGLGKIALGKLAWWREDPESWESWLSRWKRGTREEIRRCSKKKQERKGVNGISEAKREDRVRLQRTEVPGIWWVLNKYLLQVEFSFRNHRFPLDLQ